jgi:hypothetical protein
MKMTIPAIAVTAITTLPLTAHAQGVIVDEWAAAPYGAAETVVGVEDWPRFREYVVRQGLPGYRIREDVGVGYVLPERGVALYDVPRTYRVRPGYRYTIVNDVPVIVDPRSRRVVEVID